MAIFDIDEMINDPWAGLRDTDAYLNYVMMEVQRLYESGKLEVSPDEVLDKYIRSNGISGWDPITSFQFDGRKFTYIYHVSGSREKSVWLCCDDWDSTARILLKDDSNWDAQLIVWKGKVIYPSNLSFYQLMFFGCR